MSSSVHECQSPDCNLEGNLKCPICLKIGLNSYFCSQECFKRNFVHHKSLHHNAVRSTKNNLEYSPWPGFPFTGSLRPYPVTLMRTVPNSIMKPRYAESVNGICEMESKEKKSFHIAVLSKEDIEGLRKACKLGREVLDIALQASGIGVTTEEIDQIVHKACIERQCYPSTLNYHQFPKSCCTSVNEVICHGIPDARPLRDGDILNIDVTVFYKGFHGDLNETIFIGTPDAKSVHLVQTTHECLNLAMQACKPGVRYRDLGSIIEKHAGANGLSVVRSYCGHGIHRLFHCNPSIPHYGKNRAFGVMKEGHAFTIEPMINMGTYGDIMWPDNWTAVTQDGQRSAQFEHTFIVTKTGCEVLTQRTNGSKNQPWFMDQLDALSEKK
ncbi:hypothetical protein ACOME3_009451 [Neoechinorhynchus agilis]